MQCACETQEMLLWPGVILVGEMPEVKQGIYNSQLLQVLNLGPIYTSGVWTPTASTRSPRTSANATSGSRGRWSTPASKAEPLISVYACST